MSERRVTIPSGGLSLEGVWHFPDGGGPFPAVIVCHPHPLYGGSMSNNIVLYICQALARNSIAALRFNFRGVGRSSGEFGGGIAEQDDGRAALALAGATPKVDPKRIGLAGYSFGTSVIVPVAQDERVRLLALVSPALSSSGWEQLSRFNRPKLLFAGDNDFVIPERDFLQKCQDLPEPRRCRVIPGADHFWGGFEAEVAEEVAQFFSDGFIEGKY